MCGRAGGDVRLNGTEDTTGEGMCVYGCLVSFSGQGKSDDRWVCVFFIRFVFRWSVRHVAVTSNVDCGINQIKLSNNVM